MTSTPQPEAAAVRGLRPRHGSKLPVDPWRPNGWLWEEERRPGIPRIPVVTIFLAGAECPLACVFCDLWRQTLDGRTPPGAIPRQIDRVLTEAGVLPAPAAVKLYNASNFFDSRAVPPEDDAAIAARLRPFSQVIVEAHPRFIQQRCFEFADRLAGTLEVAIGLETAEADVLSRLDKQMTLDDFAGAAARLCAAGVRLRVFLLVPPPYVPESVVVTSIERSVMYAAEHGATHISLIPTRAEHTRLDDPVQRRHIVPPRLDAIEDVLDPCCGMAGVVVSVDLWDIDRLATCELCGPARIARLRAINLSGRPEARVACPTCMSLS